MASSRPSRRTAWGCPGPDSGCRRGERAGPRAGPAPSWPACRPELRLHRPPRGGVAAVHRAQGGVPRDEGTSVPRPAQSPPPGPSGGSFAETRQCGRGPELAGPGLGSWKGARHLGAVACGSQARQSGWPAPRHVETSGLSSALTPCSPSLQEGGGPGHLARDCACAPELLLAALCLTGDGGGLGLSRASGLGSGSQRPSAALAWQDLPLGGLGLGRVHRTVAGGPEAMVTCPAFRHGGPSGAHGPGAGPHWGRLGGPGLGAAGSAVSPEL